MRSDDEGPVVRIVHEAGVGEVYTRWVCDVCGDAGGWTTEGRDQAEAEGKGHTCAVTTPS